MKAVVPDKALLWDAGGPYLEILSSLLSNLVPSLGYPISEMGRFSSAQTAGEGFQIHLPALLSGGLVTQFPTGSRSS